MFSLPTPTAVTVLLDQRHGLQAESLQTASRDASGARKSNGQCPSPDDGETITTVMALPGRRQLGQPFCYVRHGFRRCGATGW